ncbi:MAG: ATP-binding protein, partial [Candidatus Woesearchaeota archaeon]
MSELIGIVGSSGEGKSTSIETLDPKSTFIINVIGKPLPFKGWKSRYIKADPNSNTGNYVETDKSAEIVSILQYVNDKRPEIKSVILEDAQYVMSTESMNRA